MEGAAPARVADDLRTRGFSPVELRALCDDAQARLHVDDVSLGGA
jgi:hypothetical protein